MIERLQEKNKLDIFDFVNTTKDVCHDFYVTIEKSRIFLKDINLIKKVLQKQEIYGVYENGLQGLLMIYREKGFRPYIKILAVNRFFENKLLKYLIWNFADEDLFVKVKKLNGLAKQLLRYGFEFQGDRGEEILLHRKKQKISRKIGEDKDDEYSS